MYRKTIAARGAGASRRLPISLALISGVVVVSMCRGSEPKVCAEQDRTFILPKTKVTHEIPSAPFEMPAHGIVWIGVTDSGYSQLRASDQPELFTFVALRP